MKKDTEILISDNTEASGATYCPLWCKLTSKYMIYDSKQLLLTKEWMTLLIGIISYIKLLCNKFVALQCQSTMVFKIFFSWGKNISQYCALSKRLSYSLPFHDSTRVWMSFNIFFLPKHVLNHCILHRNGQIIHI